jgi:hypothetical protein
MARKSQVVFVEIFRVLEMIAVGRKKVLLECNSSASWSVGGQNDGM